MDSLIFRALMGLSFPQDSREEVQSESSVIKIQIDPVGSSEDMIRVEGLEQSQSSINRIVGRLAPKKKFKSPPEIVENSATGFRAATRQWRDANPRPWCILEGYHIFDSGLSKPTIVSKAFRYMKKELAEFSGQSDLLWCRTVKRLQLESDHDGVLRGIQSPSFSHVRPSSMR